MYHRIIEKNTGSYSIEYEFCDRECICIEDENLIDISIFDHKHNRISPIDFKNHREFEFLHSEFQSLTDLYSITLVPDSGQEFDRFNFEAVVDELHPRLEKILS